MASSVKNYQCPSCTGPLGFDAETGLLACEFCGSSYAPDAIEALYGVRTEPEASAEKADMGSKEGGSPWSLAGTGGVRRCGSAGDAIMLLPLVRSRARLRSCDHSHVVSLLRQSDRDPIQGCRRAQARSRYPVQVGERCGRCCAEEALREKAVSAEVLQG